MEEKNESKKYSNSEENDAAENMSEEKTSEDNDRLDYIMKSGGVVSKTKDETIQCLTIIGQIEGHYNLGDGQKATKYEHIIPLLLSIEESDEIDGLLVVLNTMGGDVEAGACDSGNDSEYVKACRVARSRRRAFDRRTSGGIGEKVVHSAVRYDDDTSGKNQRNRGWRAADILLL